MIVKIPPPSFKSLHCALLFKKHILIHTLLNFISISGIGSIVFYRFIVVRTEFRITLTIVNFRFTSKRI